VPNSPKPPVGVVIVNHNLKDSLRETLASFRQVTYPGIKVIVSDNASTDGSQEMVRTEFPEVELLAHNPEQGYARAASLAMAALVDKTKYIFSTTNDVIVAPDMLDVLVDYAERNAEAGVLGTKIYYHGRENILWHAGGRVKPFSGFVTHFGLNRPDGPQFSVPRECDYVTGCGFLLRSALLKQIGFFNEEFVFYSEDADLCYRAKEAGYRVVYVPGARMWHKVDSTLAKNRPLQLRYSTRNFLYLLQRHRAGFYPLSLWLFIGVTCPLKMLFFAAIRHGANARGICQGIGDWFKGRTGWIRDRKA
jgi:GT2 family glycosyltransferase